MWSLHDICSTRKAVNFVSSVKLLCERRASGSAWSDRSAHLSDKVMGEWGNLLQAHQNDIPDFAGAPGPGQGVVDLATAKDDSPGLAGRQEVGLSRGHLCQMACVIRRLGQPSSYLLYALLTYLLYAL